MGQTTSYFDALETRLPEEREAANMAGLSDQVAHAMDKSPYFAEHLAGIDAGGVTGREALAHLPLTRKSDLIEIQRKSPPFGGAITCEPGELKRIFQSPGPIYDPEGYGDDRWGTARALYAAGFRAGDILHNSFAYHLTPAGAMLETGAAEIGCAVIPAGVGNTELQVRAMADIGATGYTGTPSFLKIILDKAEEMGEDVSRLKMALVGGEALPPALLNDIEGHGVSCLQVYASADLGCIAYESEARDGLIVEERLIIEIVRPGTGDPVDEGEVGEVVATSLSPEYPLIRFATGDLSAALPGISACGRTNIRLKGWMGRADQTTKVKGMFVHPSQVADIVKRHSKVMKARLIVDQRDGKDVMTLSCEVEDPEAATGRTDGLIAEITDSIQAVCKLSGEVGFAHPGSLPNDGKVIDDIRKYD